MSTSMRGMVLVFFVHLSGCESAKDSDSSDAGATDELDDISDDQLDDCNLPTQDVTYQAACNRDQSTSFCGWLVLCDDGELILYSENTSEVTARGEYTLTEDKLRYTDEALLSRSLDYDCGADEILDPAVLNGGKYVRIESAERIALCE